ncbi:MAG TPA: hypothetical protein VGJ48_01675 [Pyrinomonadaceae bacterium]|jgi:hypothetical protein
MKTGTVVTDATLNFSRAAQLQNRERAGVPGVVVATGCYAQPADSLEEVMTEQDFINAVNYVCMTKANLDLD